MISSLSVTGLLERSEAVVVVVAVQRKGLCVWEGRIHEIGVEKHHANERSKHTE